MKKNLRIRTISLLLLVCMLIGVVPAMPTAAAAGETITWKASSGFSSTQGANQWTYLEWNGSKYTKMKYNAAEDLWRGSAEYPNITKSKQHPSKEKDAVRAWTAPRAGTISITSQGKKSNTGGGDGVSFQVFKNATSIFGPKAIGATDSTGIAINIAKVSVAKGDVIYFHLNKRTTATFDATTWNPTITYISCPTHSFTTVITPATCTAAGKSQCAKCTTTTTVPALGHGFTKVVKAPTCTETGINQCVSCPVTTTVPALGHSPGCAHTNEAPSVWINPSADWATPPAGGSRTITISYYPSWTWNTPPAWVTIAKSGMSAIVSVSANNTGAARSFTLAFTSGSARNAFTITQASQPKGTAPKVSWTAWSPAASATSKAITVTSEDTCSATISHSWITLGSVTATTGSSKTRPVNVKANTSTASRKGTITFKNKNGSATVTITQAGKAPSIWISPSSDWSVSASGGSRTITVSYYTSWTLNTLPSWVKVTKSGTTAKVTVAANTGAKRAFTLAFTSGSARNAFTITQAAGSTPPPPPPSGWQWPVKNGTVSQGYHTTGPCDYNGNTPIHASGHIAIDIVGSNAILAADSGTVVTVKTGYNSGRGNYVVIDHNNGYYSQYQHLMDSSILVSVGQRITTGTQIATMGNTGESYGAHLDFQIGKGYSNNVVTSRINPLTEIGRSVV